MYPFTNALIREGAGGKREGERRGGYARRERRREGLMKRRFGEKDEKGKEN